MRVVSFITDSNEVNRLLKNLGIPTWTIPEPIKSNAPPVVNRLLFPMMSDSLQIYVGWQTAN